jgi:hypothetical protein
MHTETRRSSYKVPIIVYRIVTKVWMCQHILVKSVKISWKFTERFSSYMGITRRIIGVFITVRYKLEKKKSVCGNLIDATF